ncbi:hypothetical protein HOK51_03645 [Candidatus Woesearchaeota archaeon]|jgi:hypothetical protein|nr:hypothetical protein [Candidatus Woesearchaeota archaeon]MBT6518915.1 hypothetical protein [Candidatus Woesearchaeota archaeon]MBT7367583.1 hypothetical protein [Candidatus Woesearchaeota archaeon]
MRSSTQSTQIQSDILNLTQPFLEGGKGKYVSLLCSAVYYNGQIRSLTESIDQKQHNQRALLRQDIANANSKITDLKDNFLVKLFSGPELKKLESRVTECENQRAKLLAGIESEKEELTKFNDLGQILNQSIAQSGLNKKVEKYSEVFINLFETRGDKRKLTPDFLCELYSFYLEADELIKAVDKLSELRENNVKSGGALGEQLKKYKQEINDLGVRIETQELIVKKHSISQKETSIAEVVQKAKLTESARENLKELKNILESKKQEAQQTQSKIESTLDVQNKFYQEIKLLGEKGVSDLLDSLNRDHLVGFRREIKRKIQKTFCEFASLNHIKPSDWQYIDSIKKGGFSIVSLEIICDIQKYINKRDSDFKLDNGDGSFEYSSRPDLFPDSWAEKLMNVFDIPRKQRVVNHGRGISSKRYEPVCFAVKCDNSKVFSQMANEFIDGMINKNLAETTDRDEYAVSIYTRNLNKLPDEV